uniref:Testis expressed 30 n=1 Tax=Neogobius melanostomus TaxID=47308 RepID=A0A8C6V3S7_9GOBI
MNQELFLEENLKIPFGVKQLDAVLCRPSVQVKHGAHTGVILTHGAGGDMNFRQLVALAHALAASGFLCLRFTCKGLNLAYRVKAYHAVWEYLKTHFPSVKQVFLGGRSMGSRAAAALLRQLSDDSEDMAQGLICLSFPLHPPARRAAHQQRTEDLRQLPQQMTILFVSGTEDDMCDRDLFNTTIEKMKAHIDVFWLDGGCHGLTVKGRSEESVMEEVNAYVTTWLSKQVA